MHGTDRNTMHGTDRSRVRGTGHAWPQGCVTPCSARTEPAGPACRREPWHRHRLAAHRGSCFPPPAESCTGFTLRSAEAVCIRSAFIYHLGAPKQGEGGGTGGEDETRDCTFPSSFELYFPYFLKFFSPKRSALLSELDVTIIFPDSSVIVFVESLV